MTDHRRDWAFNALLPVLVVGFVGWRVFTAVCDRISRGTSHAHGGR